MDQVMMMSMQLVEEFSGRIANGQTLTEDEAMAYHQTLNTVQRYMKFTELSYLKAIDELQQSMGDSTVGE